MFLYGLHCGRGACEWGEVWCQLGIKKECLLCSTRPLGGGEYCVRESSGVLAKDNYYFLFQEPAEYSSRREQAGCARFVYTSGLINIYGLR